MTVPDLISNAVVERALGAPREDAGGAWLTFFLRFPNERARAVLRILEGIGLQLDDDRSTRCFYARVRIGRNAVEICRLAGRVAAICADGGAEVIAIDLDEDHDGRPSKIVNLYCTP